MNIFIRKKAFTIAEVLITLGIIGIIATMTIPPLMNNIQDKQFKEAAKEAYSKASQALAQMKQDNGGDLTSYRTPWSAFKPVFMSYFKVAQDCNWSDCVPDISPSTIYKSLDGVGAYVHNMNSGQFVTTDGMFWGIYNGAAFLSIAVDVNGYTKGPNALGKDTFMFQLLNNNLVPMGEDGTNYIGYCNRADTNMGNGLSCMYYVVQGIDY